MPHALAVVLVTAALLPLGGDGYRLWIDAGTTHGALPLTVELDLWLEPSSSYHVLIARGPKRGGHWELYTTPGDGRLAWYAPDLQPGDIQSDRSITDRMIHRVAWRCDGAVAELYVDGERVAQTSVTGGLAPASEPILIGGLVTGELGCTGAVGAMRLSHAYRELAGVTGPLSADAQTASLWRPEALRDGRIADAGPAGLTALAFGLGEGPAFERMLDEVERDEQLALELVGDESVETDLLVEAVELPARPVATPRLRDESIRVYQPLPLLGGWRLQRAEPGTGEALGYHLPGQDRSDWHEAQVPGSVQANLLRLGLMPDPFFGDTWVREVGQGPGWPQRRREPERFEWWYVLETGLPPDEPLRLRFDGVDYSARFYLNGELLGRHEGLFGGPEFDLTGRRQVHNTLAVCVEPPPGPLDGLPDWRGRPKPSVVFGWHYGHQIPMGITDYVFVRRTPPVEVLHPAVRTISLDGEIEVEFTLRSNVPELTRVPVDLAIRPAQNLTDDATGAQGWRLETDLGPGLQRIRTRLKLDHPRVWWPFGFGEQPLYDFVVWTPLDATGARFGLRTVELRQAPGAMPNQYRWQFVINGVPMFIKGANWCFIDPFGNTSQRTVDSRRLGHILRQARAAGVQMLRAWGGGPIESDTFYHLCDTWGIMVWQEFPYCFDAPDIPESNAAVLDDQALRAVRRVRNHPSLVAWAGGNEVMNQGPQGNTLKLLGKRIRQLDPTRPYHITSPWGGDVHNWNVYHGGAPIEAYRQTPTPFLTEFGLPSSMNRNSMERYLAPGRLDHWPPTADDLDIISHSQQFSLGDWGKMLTYAGDYGPVRDWDEFIRYSQMAQADAFRYGAEMQRARAGRGATGYFFYKLSDIFPGQAWASIDYYGNPKLSHWRVARMNRPQLAFATYERFQWQPGETLRAEVHVANDTLEPLDAPVRATFYDAAGRATDAGRWRARLAAGEARRIGELERLIGPDDRPLLLCLQLEGVGDSWYWFCYADLTDEVRAARALPHWGYPAERMPEVFTAYAALPPSRLRERLAKTRLEQSDWQPTAGYEGELTWRCTVRNAGTAPAFCVTVEGFPGEPGWLLSDNAFCLRPGEERELRLVTPTAASAQPTLRVRCWNEAPGV